MRFFLLMFIYGIAAIVLETTFFAEWPFQSIHVDFMIVAVAAISFYHGWRSALPLIIIYGAMMDLATGSPLGITVLSYLAVYWVIRTIISKISFQAGVGLLFWVAMISLGEKVVSSCLFAIATGQLVLPKIIMQRAPAQALLDAFLGLIMVPFLKWYGDLTWEKIVKPKGLVLK